MSCTAQPVFEVKVNGQITYLCSRCMEHNSKIEIQKNRGIEGEYCLCVKC